jgi:hypothetical protein
VCVLPLYHRIGAPDGGAAWLEMPVAAAIQAHSTSAHRAAIRDAGDGKAMFITRTS